MIKSVSSKIQDSPRCHQQNIRQTFYLLIPNSKCSCFPSLGSSTRNNFHLFWVTHAVRMLVKPRTRSSVIIVNPPASFEQLDLLLTDLSRNLGGTCHSKIMSPGGKTARQKWDFLGKGCGFFCSRCNSWRCWRYVLRDVPGCKEVPWWILKDEEVTRSDSEVDFCASKVSASAIDQGTFPLKTSRQLSLTKVMEFT